MKIIFMGTGEFSAPVLQRLLDSQHEIVAVVTQPDRPKGRSSRPVPPPVKELATSRDVPVLQPENVNDNDSVKKLKDYAPDLIIAVAFGQRLSPAVLSIPRIFCVNLHASLLPKYRGAAPINWAIIRGESETGLTLIRMEEKIDTGATIAERRIPIDSDETAGELHDRLAQEGADFLVSHLKEIESNKLQPIPQLHVEATDAPKLKKEDGNITWSKCAEELRNFIRGMTPWPGAFSFLSTQGSDKTQRIVILHSSVVESAGTTTPPGTITEVSDSGLRVATGSGDLLINKLKPSGGRPMSAADFIHGHKVTSGDIFRELPETPGSK